MFLLYRFKAVCGKSDGLRPLYFTPLTVGGFPNHGARNAVRVCGITPGETSLHTRVSRIGATLLIGNHTDQLIATQLRDEGTTHTAVGTGRFDFTRRYTQVDNLLFLKRCRRAGLNTGATGHALTIQKGIFLAGRYLRFKTPCGDGQSKRTLNLGTGAHAATTHDALASVKTKVRVGIIFTSIEMIRTLFVAHRAQPNHTRHVLKLAVTIGRASQAIERVV